MRDLITFLGLLSILLSTTLLLTSRPAQADMIWIRTAGQRQMRASLMSRPFA